jgi:hypothetical protein
MDDYGNLKRRWHLHWVEEQARTAINAGPDASFTLRWNREGGGDEIRFKKRKTLTGLAYDRAVLENFLKNNKRK